jgi:hypothetical protein
MAYDAVEALLQFGVAMLRAGNTAARTHEWIEVIARKLTFDSVSVSQSLDSLVITVRGSGEWITVLRNARRLRVRNDRVVQSRANGRSATGVSVVRFRHRALAMGPATARFFSLK